MTIVALLRSPAHNYFGHYGKPAGKNPIEEIEMAELHAFRGLVGDRFYGQNPAAKGQITFFAEEVWRRLQDKYDKPDVGPGVFRRNVIVRGGDLDALVGQEFEVQGIRFAGSEYCKPCFWMDQAFAPGTYDTLVAWHAGGLRARILTDGNLSVDAPKAAVVAHA